MCVHACGKTLLVLIDTVVIALAVVFVIAEIEMLDVMWSPVVVIIAMMMERPIVIVMGTSRKLHTPSIPDAAVSSRAPCLQSVMQALRIEGLRLPAQTLGLQLHNPRRKRWDRWGSPRPFVVEHVILNGQSGGSS